MVTCAIYCNNNQTSKNHKLEREKMRVHMQVGGGKNQLIIKLQLHAEREYIKEETGSIGKNVCQ